MLKSVRVKRILTLAIAVLLVASVAVAGVMFSGTDKSKGDILGGSFESVKLDASSSASASNAIFDVEVTQDGVNKITVKGSVNLNEYSGSIAVRVGTDVLHSQIFGLIPDAVGMFENEYVINNTFAREYANELPIFICYGDQVLDVGTVGIITYDYDSGILGYPAGSEYIDANGDQVALEKPYAPLDAADENGNVTVVYETNMFTFKANPTPVADSPAKGDDGVYDQIGVDEDNDGDIDSITAFIKTTDGREYAVVKVVGSIGPDYGIPANAWVSYEAAMEFKGLQPGAKYTAWVRVAGVDGELLPSAPVFLGEFEAMDAEAAAAKAEFLAKYEEVTVTKGHKLYDSVDPSVTATPSETLQLLTLYNRIPVEYRNTVELATKGQYLVISNYLANYQDIINDARKADEYNDLRGAGKYSYGDMIDAFNAFSDVYDILGVYHLSDAADAEFVIDLANTISKIFALAPIDVNDVAKDVKYEVIDYFYGILDDKNATVEERYANAGLLAYFYGMYRDEYNVGQFIKKYDLYDIDVISTVDVATLEAMLADLKEVEIFNANGFGEAFVNEAAHQIYVELVNKYIALVAAIDAKNDDEVIAIKALATEYLEELLEVIESGMYSNVFELDAPKALYDSAVAAANIRFTYTSAISTVTALKNGDKKIEDIVDIYLDFIYTYDDVWQFVFDNPDAFSNFNNDINVIVDDAQKSVAFELALKKAYADIEAMKDDTDNVIKAANKYVLELDGVIYSYAVYDAGMSEIAAIVANAKSETDFEKAVNAAKSELAADVAAKKGNGRYNEFGKERLDAMLSASLVNLNNFDYAAGKRIADVDALVAAAKAEFASVDVVIITVGEGEYANENPTDLNVKLVNNNGMSSALTISVKLAETKSELDGSNLVVVTGEFTDEMVQAAVDGKDIIATFNISATNAKADNGYYTVKLMLPKGLRTAEGIQIVSENGENVYVYETAKAGAYVTFKTTTLEGTYHVLSGEPASYTWLVVLLCILGVAIIGVLVFVLVKSVMASFVPFFLVPLAGLMGVVPAVITVTALALIAIIIKYRKIKE